MHPFLNDFAFFFVFLFLSFFDMLPPSGIIITSISLRYDLMVGVTRAEAFFSFNSEDIQYGIEADRRAKILRTYVRNTYSFHLNEIFATIINEYTDWERPVQHPINIR